MAATPHLTAMHVGDRTKDIIDAGGIWPAFTGVLVRDGYAGYETAATPCTSRPEPFCAPSPDIAT